MKKISIFDLMKQRPVIFDGAMGTMIYQQGVFLNACYDELSLSKPDLIRKIHSEYVEAGAEIIETNTFGANRLKLAAFGLADKMEAINKAAVRLAREAAGENVYVAASIGPCLESKESPSDSRMKDITDAFKAQIDVLVESGVDLFLFETFHHIDELTLAVKIARDASVPVLASLALAHEGDPDGAIITKKATLLDADSNVDIIGINCGSGPAEYLSPVKNILKNIKKPLLVMPNAGGPSEVGGRMLYLNSPEYFTEFCKRFIEMGAKGIGGCCGTTPTHIRMAVKAVKNLSGVKQHLTVVSAPSSSATERSAQPIPVEKKSKLATKLYSGKQVKLIELLPPSDPGKIDAFIEKCRSVQAGGIDAINLPDGPRASARVSVIATAVAMQRELDIEPIPHCCCRDRNLIGLQSDILGGFSLGLKTWLFITGDPPKLGNYPDATGVFDLDAIGVTRLVANLNRAFDAAGQPIASPTSIFIGVGANPVAVEMEREIRRYGEKLDAGAEYAITQPVFDTDALFRFLDAVSRHEKMIPVIAGIFPLLSFKNAEFMNKYVPGVVVPDKILSIMKKCKTREDGIKAGIEIAIQTRDKIADRVAGFQISAPLGKTDVALAVLE